MSPVGATYMQHLQWVEQEVVSAKLAHHAADKLSRDARGMSDIIERADGYQAEAPKLAASVVQQAESQMFQLRLRIASLETEAARTRAVLAGIAQ